MQACAVVERAHVHVDGGCRWLFAHHGAADSRVERGALVRNGQQTWRGPSLCSAARDCLLIERDLGAGHEEEMLHPAEFHGSGQGVGPLHTFMLAPTGVCCDSAILDHGVGLLRAYTLRLCCEWDDTA